MRRVARPCFLLIALIAALTLASCSSAPRTGGEGDPPGWTRQPARTVDGGYIVYVESAEDRSLAQANFKAESAALQDVANECSFAPKGTRVESRFSDTVGVLHRSYAKVAVAFEDCDEAQRAVEPSEIQKLASVGFAQQLKRYEDELDREAAGGATDTVASEQQDANPMLASTGAPPPIRDRIHFFVVRQQIAYVKEVIILSPPSTYPPQAPLTIRTLRTLAPATRAVASYQARNPETRSWSSSWSGLSYRPAVPALAGMRGVRSTLPVGGYAAQRQWSARNALADSRGRISKEPRQRGMRPRRGWRHGWRR